MTHPADLTAGGHNANRLNGRYNVQWQVTCTDFHSRGITWNQCDTDTDVFFITHQAIRIIKFECQAYDRRHG